MCERSVCDEFFISKRPSVIAFSSIMCSIEFAIDFYTLPPTPSSIGCKNDYQISILYSNRAKFLEVMKCILPLDKSSFLEEIDLCRNRLQRTYEEGCYRQAFPLDYSPPVAVQMESCHTNIKSSLNKRQSMSPSYPINFFKDALEIDTRQVSDDDISLDDCIHTQLTNKRVIHYISFDENEVQILRKQPRSHDNECIQ